MIDLDRSVLRKIKRANTDWWINEKAIVGANGKTNIAYYTDMGEIHVKELDAKCSRALSHDVQLCTLNQNYADEHNAPSICILENGKINLSKLVIALAKMDCEIISSHEQDESLENYFINLIGGDRHD